MSTPLKILITGATGLVGKEVGKALTQAGHQVVAVSRSRQKALIELPFASEIVEWDPKKPTPLPQVDGVVHLMGENLADQRWTEAVKKQLVESRVQSTLALIDSVPGTQGEGRLKFWIQASAIGIYGKAALKSPVDEANPPGEGFLADLCVKWESAIGSLSPHLRRVVLRLGVVMSHRGGAFEKMVVPVLQGVGGDLGSGEQAMSIIHLHDLVRFIVMAVEKTQIEGVFNLVSQEPIAQHELTQKICQELHVRSGPPAPQVVLRAVLGEMSAMLLDSLSVRSRRLQEVGFQLDFPTSDSIIREVTSWHRHPEKVQGSAFIKYTEQFVPLPVGEVFEFFSAAENLETITPDFLNFKILSLSTPKIEEGTRIRYQLKIHGLPLQWLTHIRFWDPPRKFVDVQEKGPYSLWYHEHHFLSIPGGTLIQDWVRYRFPLGLLGQWVAYLKVKSDIDQIFAFRRQVIAKRLPQLGA